MIEWLILLILFFAFFIQSMTGFGSALIAMPLLISIVGVETASPMFALVAQVAGIGILIRYRREWNWRAVWRVAAGSVIAIPLGVWGAQQIDEQIVMFILGIFTTGYAIYALMGIGVPKIHNQQWAYGIGMMSGLLHGAYNTGGPPLVIYGNSQDWEPGEFKSNIQSMFFINGFLAITTHAATGNIDSHILTNFAFAVPVIIIAQRIGFALDKYINPELFRRGVLVLLIFLGLRLIF